MRLTPLQRQIAQRVAEGWTYPTIATFLGTNPRKVRHHACEAARKVAPRSKLPTRQRLTRWWYGHP